VRWQARRSLVEDWDRALHFDRNPLLHEFLWKFRPDWWPPWAEEPRAYPRYLPLTLTEVYDQWE
jgi:hypothetical protein